MTKRIPSAFLLLFFLLSGFHTAIHPAELTIEKISDRKLTIKIMEAGENGKSSGSVIRCADR